jgi:RimJ/RimL family protein N-acetyltransferase
MILETERLLLRPPVLSDAPAIAAAINDHRIAATALNIPYPYSTQDGVKWIKSLRKRGKSKSVNLSVFLRETGELIGGIGLMDINEKHHRAELGYWCAVKYWGKGLITEAAARIVRYGFEELDLVRIAAICMVSNPASARVMEKIGMKHEGV